MSLHPTILPAFLLWLSGGSKINKRKQPEHHLDHFSQHLTSSSSADHLSSTEHFSNSEGEDSHWNRSTFLVYLSTPWSLQKRTYFYTFPVAKFSDKISSGLSFNTFYKYLIDSFIVRSFRWRKTKCFVARSGTWYVSYVSCVRELWTSEDVRWKIQLVIDFLSPLPFPDSSGYTD